MNLTPTVSTASVTTATLDLRLPSHSGVKFIAERKIATHTDEPIVTYTASILIHYYGASADRYATFEVSGKNTCIALFNALKRGSPLPTDLLHAVYASNDSRTGEDAFNAVSWTTLVFAEMAHELGYDATAARKGFIQERATA